MNARTQPLLNTLLTEKLGIQVLEIEVLPIRKGDELTLEFIRDDGVWRRGVLLMTKGVLEINSVRDSQLTLWRDTAPTKVPVVCRSTKTGYLEIFNVWDRGKNREFRRLHSGMIKRQVDAATYEYRCMDSHPDPLLEDFERFVFRLTMGAH
jgi:hypothetical protein